ncbi:hypothetical protein GALMADRAFT_68330 [Galerina marginata CBS 339.88]|uniref:Phosphatidate cytidylyltransferase n=1 Tax=Galerina marginata (strain CBS 339.88) TaxID=685588 RepID=A0A067T7H2_GALM3|nr:hypothetical protein GALMADRAFT_68330 [Galerina marginata CBS 339.88]
MTKSAVKKAQRLARIEQKKHQKHLKAQARSQQDFKTELDTTPPSPQDQSSGIVTEEEPSHPPSQASPLSETSVLDLPEVDNEKSNVAYTLESAHSAPSDAAKLEETSLVPSSKDAPEAKVELGTRTILAVNGNGSPASSHLAQDPEKVKKRQNALTRILWTFIMIGGFIALLLLGHAYMILLVMLCQTLVYREVTALFSLKTAAPESRDVEPLKGKDPWSKTLNWYFFAVTNYFLYGESIIYYFKHVVFADANLLPFATNHRMISFTLYTIGFMGFVMSLKKGYLKQQFGLFCWVHMSLLLIVVSSHFIVNNILEGLIWFWVPASLVICNDCFAYIWGVTVGRTPLIKLSPKKTVEGFVGAFISTVIFAVFWGTYFMRFDYMICPVHDLGVSAWSSTGCSPNPVFVWKVLDVWPPVSVFLTTLTGHAVKTLSYAPYQLHLLVLACFASLVAPFGGFFASGFKRAFNIKDFGHSIPGHGGMTDRMDCQFLMGIFTYVYYSSLIRVHHVTVGGVLQTVVSGLTVEQQLELIGDLKGYLERQGIAVP